MCNPIVRACPSLRPVFVCVVSSSRCHMLSVAVSITLCGRTSAACCSQGSARLVQTKTTLTNILKSWSSWWKFWTREPHIVLLSTQLGVSHHSLLQPPFIRRKVWATSSTTNGRNADRKETLCNYSSLSFWNESCRWASMFPAAWQFYCCLHVCMIYCCCNLCERPFEQQRVLLIPIPSKAPTLPVM